ncbi:hypothetical protein K2Z83_22810 [Oscillochloris sp. ZM17-4]|uniref:DNA-primase RepB domain-containing protein n=1 Tax=Oscillochloris sp. ZM17-4 TaxID=2866714 RepID=UPI001C735C3C|nr:DNA-primase RepB domain-containing protein [Oscillochloris sp. ZM17-4]MBX0330490.1 hypothetical protein [Oscillochloris sp. ZM17-4]
MTMSAPSADAVGETTPTDISHQNAISRTVQPTANGSRRHETAQEITHQSVIFSSSPEHSLSDTERQIHALHGLGDGWVSVWYCEGDPSAKDAQLFQFSWHHATQWREIVRDIERCAARYGDVYVSLTQHTEPRRQEKTAYACLWLWIDDIKNLDLIRDAALVLETTPGNYQVLFRLSRPLTAAERRVLQRRGRVALGGDPASSDPVKPIRVAGGYNTKAQQGERNEQNHQVRLVWLNGNEITPEELSARWPEVAGGLDGGELTDIPEGLVEVALGNIDAHRQRARQTVRPQSIAARTLKDPGSAPTPSEARYRVIYGLASVGFLDHEIAALIVYWTKAGTLPCGKQRTIQSLLNDVARCISKALPQIQAKLADKGRELQRRPTGGGYTQTSTPLRQPRVKAGLQHLASDAYLTWLHNHAAGGAVAMTVSQIVTALAGDGISVSRTTIERRERELTDAGHLQRQHGRLILTGADAPKSVIIPHDPPAKSFIILHEGDNDGTRISRQDEEFGSSFTSIETQSPLQYLYRIESLPASDGVRAQSMPVDLGGVVSLPAAANGVQAQGTPVDLGGVVSLPAAANGVQAQGTPVDLGGVVSLPAVAGSIPAVAASPAPDALPPGCMFAQCDYAGYRSRYGVYWTVSGPDGYLEDVYETRESAAFWARRRWNSPPAPVSLPTAEQPDDEIVVTAVSANSELPTGAAVAGTAPVSLPAAEQPDEDLVVTAVAGDAAVAGTAPVVVPAPEQPDGAPADANLYVEYGTLAGEPDAMGEVSWMNLMAQFAPIGELLDPGAVAAWMVNGICEVPAEDLPTSECVNDDEVVIAADDARIFASRAPHVARQPCYDASPASLIAQEAPGAMEQTIPALVIRDAIAAQKSVSHVAGCRAVVYEGGASYDPNRRVELGDARLRGKLKIGSVVMSFSGPCMPGWTSWPLPRLRSRLCRRCLRPILRPILRPSASKARRVMWRSAACTSFSQARFGVVRPPKSRDDTFPP